MGVPLSGTTEKLMLVCCAHTWAASRMIFSQAAAEPNLALKVANRLLPTWFWPLVAMLVPSGMKLMVMSCGLGQALPVAV